MHHPPDLPPTIVRHAKKKRNVTTNTGKEAASNRILGRCQKVRVKVLFQKCDLEVL